MAKNGNGFKDTMKSVGTGIGVGLGFLGEVLLEIGAQRAKKERAERIAASLLKRVQMNDPNAIEFLNAWPTDNTTGIWFSDLEREEKVLKKVSRV